MFLCHGPLAENKYFSSMRFPIHSHVELRFLVPEKKGVPKKTRGIEIPLCCLNKFPDISPVTLGIFHMKGCYRESQHQ